MKIYSVKTIDNIGRLILPGELRKDLSLESGTKLYLLPINSIVILYTDVNKKDISPQSIVAEVDIFGRITLPRELMETMNWKEKDDIKAYHADEKTAILRMEEDGYKHLYARFGPEGITYP